MSTASDIRLPSKGNQTSSAVPTDTSGWNSVVALAHRKSTVLTGLLLFGLVVWVFLPSLQCDFLFTDESAYVITNPHVNNGLSWPNFAWAFHSLGYANWHPLTWLSHMLDCQLYGLKPWGHHLTSVCLHALNTVLVFAVFKRMTGSMWQSVTLAVLFGLHPLRVQSVTWISERKDVLSLSFWMLTMWAYVRFAEESRMQSPKAKVFYGLVLLFFVFGLMSKTMLVTLPFVLLLLDYWPLERWRQRSLWRLIAEKAPLFVLTIIVSWIAYVAQKTSGMMREMAGVPLSDRVGNALISYGRYLIKFFWPTDLCVHYPHPGHWPTSTVVWAGLFVLAVSATAWQLRRRMPYVLVGWLWYLGTLVPVIGLVQLLSHSMADRYTYIPTIGIALSLVGGLGAILEQSPRSRVVLSAVATAVAVVCVLQTRDEIAYWKDGATLWSRAVEVTENNYVAHYVLGTVLNAASRSDEAFDQFQEAVRLKPDYVLAQNDLGCAFFARGRFDEAIIHFQMALKAAPDFGKAWSNCGRAFLQTGQLEQAITCFEKSVVYEPGENEFRLLLDGASWVKTRIDELNHELREILKLNPDRPDHLNNLAWLLATSPSATIRNGKEAVQLATRACELTQYQIPVCVGTLSAAYAEAGRFDEAITTSELACSLASQSGEQTLLQKNQELLTLFRAHRKYYEHPARFGAERFGNSLIRIR